MNRLLIILGSLLVVVQSVASPFHELSLEDIDFSDIQSQSILESKKVPERSVLWNNPSNINSVPDSSEIFLSQVYSDNQQAWEEFLAVQHEGKFLPLTWETELSTEAFLKVDSSLDQAYKKIYRSKVDENISAVEIPVNSETLEVVIRTSELPVTIKERKELLDKIIELEAIGEFPVVRLEYNADGTVQYTVEGTKNPKQVAAEFYNRIESIAHSIDSKSCESIWTSLADVACNSDGRPLVWMSFILGLQLPESATDTERMCFDTLLKSIDVIKNSGTEERMLDENRYPFYRYNHLNTVLQKKIVECSKKKLIPVFKYPSSGPVKEETETHQFKITQFVRKFLLND